MSALQYHQDKESVEGVVCWKEWCAGRSGLLFKVASTSDNTAIISSNVWKAYLPCSITFGMLVSKIIIITSRTILCPG